MKEVRTRFAPSPTGLMHVGGVRTALFAWLYARQNNGKFILRIEDTDKSREDKNAIKQIIESLNWLGLNYDEGPDIGGEFGPYIQSQRLKIYHKYAKELINKGLAYADPYSKEELEQFRKDATKNNKPFLFRDYRPDNPPQWDGSQPLRFKVPELKRYEWNDVVRGKLSAGEEALDDFIIIKPDGYPTYNFAHIIDDHLMKITHVMRGEEFIASMPKFLSLIDAFGWEWPVFVTLPPVLNPRGGKKLSKRDGAKSILEYRDQGYLPEAIINFLATLGWNDGTEQEVFTVKEILEKFSLERIQRGGAKFDEQRLIWLNGQHIRRLETKVLFDKIPDHFWPKASNKFSREYKLKVLALVQERLKFFAELKDLTWFFFEQPEPNIEEITKHDKAAKQHLLKVLKTISDSDFSESDLENRLRALAQELDLPAGKLFGLIRIAITGQKVAPGLFETMHTLGKEQVLKRIDQVVNNIKAPSVEA